MLSLHVHRQPGAPFAPLSELHMEVSFDDGAHWTPVRVEAGDGGPGSGTAGGRPPDALAVVDHPKGDGFASLRFRAEDARGNAVVQTVIRAYSITTAR